MFKLMSIHNLIPGLRRHGHSPTWAPKENPLSHQESEGHQGRQEEHQQPRVAGLHADTAWTGRS